MPLSQLQSASEKGSVTGAFGAPGLLVSADCGAVAAATRLSVGTELFADVTDDAEMLFEAGVGCAKAAFAGDPVGAPGIPADGG